jgi:RNA polymerase sigma-70 factor (ECF subfamily)
MDGGRDDAALVQAAQRGDQGAFVCAHRPSRRVDPQHDHAMLVPTTPEDAAQDAFVSAFTALAGFKHESKFSTWLYRIAVNKCHDRLRARRAFDVSLDEEHDDGWEPPRRRNAALGARAERDGRRHRARHPLTCRRSIANRSCCGHVEGLDYDEMSTILDAPRDTVKMRVYKARGLLCRALAHLSGAYR